MQGKHIKGKMQLARSSESTIFHLEHNPGTDFHTLLSNKRETRNILQAPNYCRQSPCYFLLYIIWLFFFLEIQVPKKNGKKKSTQ